MNTALRSLLLTFFCGLSFGCLPSAHHEILLEDDELEIDKNYSVDESDDLEDSTNCSNLKQNCCSFCDKAPVFELENTCCCGGKKQKTIQDPLFDNDVNKSVMCLAEAPKGDKNAEPQQKFFKLESGDSVFELVNKLRIDALYGVNLRGLNNKNNEFEPQLDKIIWPGRHVLDLGFLYSYGNLSHGYDLARVKIGLRNRNIWGNENSIFSTGKADVRLANAYVGEHEHAITRQLFWARELWFETSLKDLMCLENRHVVTLGIFPFSVGRGIALGDAYSVDAQFFGDYAAAAIDQFAPGFRLSGEFIAPCVLNYDFYAEIISNKSSSFSDVNSGIYGQRFGRRDSPARGAGAISYIVLTRVKWKPHDTECDRIEIEPYAFYTNNQEQKHVFPGDAKVTFGTFGLAAEFEQNCWEFGFDGAVDIGVQKFFGWDYNTTRVENHDGYAAFILDKILDNPPSEDGSPVFDTPAHKKCANSVPAGQGSNAQPIDGDDCEGLYNSRSRFVNPYNNYLRRGGMFVADIAYNFGKNIKLAATAGFATGDTFVGPLRNLTQGGGDHVYTGFLPQQSLYQGKRVQSILFFGQGQFPRPVTTLDVTLPDVIEDQQDVTTRFTNIILTGAAFTLKPTILCRKWEFVTNVLGFWSYITPHIFVDGIDHHAGRYYGTEVNLKAKTKLKQNLELFIEGALFVPGSLYKSFAELKPIPLRGSKGVAGADNAYYIMTGINFEF